ncbi:MAG: glycosyltransferase family 2 protein [bacterium]
MSHEQEVEISIIIVTFNNENEILACLDALLRELGHCSFQIILVDNNSQDRTRELIHENWSKFQSQNGETIFISNSENCGFTRALNQGLRNCNGKDILILNPDTELQSGSLMTLRDTLRCEPNFDVVAPQLLNPDGSVQSSCRRFPRHRDVLFDMIGLSSLFRKSKVFNHWKMGDFDHQNRRSVDQPQGACLMFSRQLLHAVGFWDENFPMFFSDVDWCQRVILHGYSILFEPAAKVMHHKGRSVEQSRPEMIWSSHHSFYKYFKKHKKALRFLILNEMAGFILLFLAIFRIFWKCFAGFIVKDKK